jgi:hypothetical protein
MSELEHAQLIAWLQDQGHNEDDIQKILAKVAEYDAQTMHESIFDSISSGQFNFAALVKEALEGEPPAE